MGRRSEPGHIHLLGVLRPQSVTCFPDFAMTPLEGPEAAGGAKAARHPAEPDAPVPHAAVPPGESSRRSRI